MMLRKQTDLDKNNSFFREWIGGKSKTSDKYQKSGTGYRAAKFQLDTNKARYTMMLNAGAKIDRARKNLAFAVSGESPPWDLTTRHSPSYVYTCVYTQQGEFTTEGSRLKGCKANLLSRTVHQGRARQISRPTRVSDSSGSRTIVKIYISILLPFSSMKLLQVSEGEIVKDKV